MGVIVDSGLGKRSLLVKVLSLFVTFFSHLYSSFRLSVFYDMTLFCNYIINIYVEILANLEVYTIIFVVWFSHCCKIN